MQSTEVIIFNHNETEELFSTTIQHGKNVDLNFIQRQGIKAFVNSDSYRQIHGKIKKNNFVLAIARRISISKEVF